MTQLVTMTLEGSCLGIDVASAQDVVRLGALTPVPLAADWIAGMMNLRGHIVTAIDMRARLGLPPAEKGQKRMCVVVTVAGEAYALIVDGVGEVMTVSEDEREPDPATLSPCWRAVSRGVVKRDDQLIVEIDAATIVGGEFRAAA
ncbi:MAG: chemotaxis protein CheW [Pacificimonas sp.]